MRSLPVALLSLAACATAATSPAARPSAAAEPARVEFIEDDVPRAVALAKERKVPLFVDAWASW